jgi:hypothetical protein
MKLYTVYARAFVLGKLLAWTARRDKHSSLFWGSFINEEKKDL